MLSGKLVTKIKWKLSGGQRDEWGALTGGILVDTVPG